MSDAQSMEACLNAVGEMVADVEFTEQEAQAIAKSALKWWVMFSVGAEKEKESGGGDELTEMRDLLEKIMSAAGKEINVNVDGGKLASAWRGDVA